MAEEFKSQHVPLEVIESRLLIALNDESKVAMVVDQKELEVIVEAMSGNKPTPQQQALHDRLLDGMRKLMEQAFSTSNIS